MTATWRSREELMHQAVLLAGQGVSRRALARALGVNDGHRVNGPWMSADDSDDCHVFSGIDAEHVSYLYHDGNMTACDFAGELYELRINGVHDHDAIVNFFNGGFDARVSA
jgi:hypothetical protein